MDKTSLDLTQELFALIKRFSPPKLKQSAIDGLTRSEYELLVMLVMNINEDRPAFTVTQISTLLQITPAGVTHLINPLETAGYVERLPDPKDRRIVLIGLTTQGTHVAQSLLGEVQENLIGLIQYLGKADSRTLIRLMAKAIDYFARQSES